MSLEDHKRTPTALNKKSKLIGFVLLIAIVFSGFYFIKPFRTVSEKELGQNNEDKSPVAVLAQAASQGDVPVYLDALGTVAPLQMVRVRSRVDGELVRVMFKEGAMVKAGDLLAEIDPRPIQIQLMQAEGQLLKDEALLTNARLDLQRYNTLLAQDSIAAQQTATQAALVKQYEGTVATDMAVVANAKLQLAYTKISAPISGRLGLRLVDQGNLVHAADVNGLVVITQVQPIAVVFTVPEDAVAVLTKTLHAGQSLMVEAYGRTGKSKLGEGQLLAMDNQIDVSTGTLKLKAQFANTEENLFANQFVNVKLLVNILRSAMLIPSTAVQLDQQGAFVYVVDSGQTVSMRQVTLGASYQDQVVVTTGIHVNELVVIDGMDKLKEGAKVKVKLAQLAANRIQ